MKWHEKMTQKASSLLHRSIETMHGRIILCGLFVGLCYFPVWCFDLVGRAIQGSTGLILIAGVLYLGLHELWGQRQQLAALHASDEDRLLGYIFILSGVVLFPFCRFALWSQAALWGLVLVGIACSSYGVDFFRRYTRPVLLIAASLYPRPGVAVVLLWESFTPPQLLERLMAWAGSLALHAIGQPAAVSGTTIALPGGAVEVARGCNGFNMAFAMAITGLLLGLFFKQSRINTITLIVAGMMLALLFNIPRIMLVTLAAVYWGEQWFHFWHGSWGAQIFVGVLFTAYYYPAMWWVNRRPEKARA